ncbi:UNVERIFIED_CONTAM: hypothetical protein FKN15_069421 [Acipenser sinensis]
MNTQRRRLGARLTLIIRPSSLPPHCCCISCALFCFCVGRACVGSVPRFTPLLGCAGWVCG